ncbi:MAG TPA: hypothetical protein VFK04_14980 [Gemmatimonadaceae bacterium]|nr:hypothetical protein [Gemmatimonadaceae bacterium]
MTALLVAVRDALLVLSRESGRWVADSRFSGKSRLQCVATDPRRPERIYCGTSRDGLWRSDDLGRSWTPVGSGRLADHVTAVAVSAVERGAANDSVVYAGTEPSALYRSADAGESWEERHSLLALPSSSSWSFPPRPNTSHVRWIAPDPLVPERIFVAIEAGALVTSPDSGLTWTDRRPDGPYDTHTLVVHPHAAGRLYSAAGDGYFESMTSGVSWERREDGLTHRYVYGLAVEADDPDTVLISAARGAMSAHDASRAESWIFRRTSGEPWRAVSRGLPESRGTTISSLISDPSDPAVVYAANNHGVYRSDDMGESWKRLGILWPESYHSERVAGLAVTTAN